MTIDSTIARSLIALLTLVAYLATGTASLAHDSSHSLGCEAHAAIDERADESSITCSGAGVEADDAYCSFCVHGAPVALLVGDPIGVMVPTFASPTPLLPHDPLATHAAIVLSLRAPPSRA